MLSVFMVLSVSVESAMECQMTCLMKCFLRCVFERYDAVCRVSTTRRNRLWRPRKPADPSIADFLEHLTAAGPRPVIHAGRKCPQFCGIWQELDTEQAVLRARSTRRSLRERGLESKAVETRLCRATLCCSAHKQAWNRATARCPGSVKTYAQAP